MVNYDKLSILSPFFMDVPWMFHGFSSISSVIFPRRTVPDLGVLQGQLSRDFPQLRLGGGWKILAHGQCGHEGQEVLDLHL